MDREWSLESRHGTQLTTHVDVLVAELAARQGSPAETAQLAVASIHAWWEELGRER